MQVRMVVNNLRWLPYCLSNIEITNYRFSLVGNKYITLIFSSVVSRIKIKTLKAAPSAPG